jgi:signal transduction histidine kinase/ligand-binding sensor domain-containing protein
VGGYVSRPASSAGERIFTAVDTLRSHHIFRVLEDRRGKIWFATHLGVLCFDPALGDVDASDAWLTQTSFDGSNFGWANDLIEDRNGVLWIATRRSGLIRYDPSATGDSGWQSFAAAEGLPSNNVRSVVEDRGGEIWVGTPLGGVFRFDGNRFQAGPESWRIYTDRTTTIGKDITGDLWFGGPGILARYATDDIRVLSTADGIASPIVSSIAREQNGTLWVGTRSGLARFSNDLWTTFSEADGLPQGGVNDIFIDDRGVTWTSGTQGLFSYNGRQFSRILSLEGEGIYGMPDGRVLWSRSRSLLLVDQNGFEEYLVLDRNVRGRPQQDRKGDLWIPTFEGIVKYNGTDTTLIGQSDGLVGEVVNVIYRDRDDHLWIGTSSGLSRHDDMKDTFENYTTDDGLGDNYITCIAQDHTGVYWFGTLGGGITRYDGQTFQTLTEDDGLPSNLVSSIVPDGKDGVWIGSSNGLVHYRPGQKETPRARIGAVVADQRYDKPDALSLASDLPLISIEMQGNSLKTFPGNLVYRYRLVGFDDAWRNTRDRRIEYEDLSTGSYTFEVQAVDRDLVYSEPAQLALSVHLPYERIGLWSGLGIAIVLLGLQAVRIVRNNRRLSETNTALSGANHELFEVNQELQRGQVLERLRARAQGMQSSDEIGQIAEAVLKETKNLGLSLTSVTLSLIENTQVIYYSTNQQGRVTEPVYQPYDPTWPPIVAKQSGESHHYQHLEGEQTRDTIRRGVLLGIPYFRDVPEADWPNVIETYFVYFEDGWVRLNALSMISEEDLMVIKRFGETFGFAYTRHKELLLKEAQNSRLAVDAAVASMRAEVQAMDEAADFERILGLLAESLGSVGLTFSGCEIDVLDEPVENPTMDHFASKGFRYTTFKLDPAGRVGTNSYSLTVPFPTVIERTIDRFVAGEPWRGTSEGDAIVEVPAGSYGRLRLTAPAEVGFEDDQVSTLQEFAMAVALGYARYLDIREIQEQTERKSAFLASMSHELRTPMNAIIGFTRMVMRRAGDVLPERQKQNLEKVTQSADHLLVLINSILDLSKIEAGRMDVEVSRFAVEKLITGCCATVGPLVKTGVVLTHEVTDGVTEAETDEGRLRQITINLLSNALKFTDTGKVTVRAMKESGSTGDTLVIAVSDTGSGIPADALETIFEEFQQVKGTDPQRKGTGLGLPITKGFAELLGGSIHVESEVGKGSMFTVRVPVVYNAG